MRFEVGEIAILALSTIPNDPDLGGGVEIIATPRGASWMYRGRIVRADLYLIATSLADNYGSYIWSIAESSLRKRRPPIPEEVLRVFDVVGEPA